MGIIGTPTWVGGNSATTESVNIDCALLPPLSMLTVGAGATVLRDSAVYVYCHVLLQTIFVHVYLVRGIVSLCSVGFHIGRLLEGFSFSAALFLSNYFFLSVFLTNLLFLLFFLLHMIWRAD